MPDNEDEYYLQDDEQLFKEAQAELQRDKWTARRAMLGAMLSNFCVGNYFLYGDYNDEVAQWLQIKDESVTLQSTLMVQPLWLMCQTLITTIGVKLADKFGFRPVIYVSIFMFALVNLLTSFAQSYIPYVILYGAGSGLCLGLCYLLSLYIAWTYYPNSKAIVTGMVLFATGLNPAILAPVTSIVLSPDNTQEKEHSHENIPKLFRFLAILYSSILVLVILILPPPKKSKELQRQTMVENGVENQVEEENVELNKFLSEAEERNLKDKALIDSIPMDDDTKKDKGVENPSGVCQKKGSGLFRPSVRDSKRLTGTYRNSIAYLKTQNVFNDINNMASSESMVLMYGMNQKYVQNLRNLNQEKEELHRRTMGLHEMQRYSLRQSISAQKNLTILRNSVMKARKENRNVSEILPRETIAKIVTEYADEMEPEEVEDIAEQLIEAQCPDMATGLKHPNFTLLVIMCIGSTVYNFFMNAAWKAFAKEKLSDGGTELSLILSIAAIFEAISGLLAGTFLMFIPFKYFYVAQCIIQLIAILTINTVATSFGSITVYVSLSMYLLGSDKTVFPTITQKIFGPIAGPKIYPFVYVFFAVSSLIQFIIFNYITTDFSLIFKIFAVMTSLSLGATFFVNMKPTFIRKEDQGGEARRTSSQRFIKSSTKNDPNKSQVDPKKQPPKVYEGIPPDQYNNSLDVRESPLITEPLDTLVKESVPVIEEEEDGMDSVIDEEETKAVREMQDRITQARAKDNEDTDDIEE